MLASVRWLIYKLFHCKGLNQYWCCFLFQAWLLISIMRIRMIVDRNPFMGCRHFKCYSFKIVLSFSSDSFWSRMFKDFCVLHNNRKILLCIVPDNTDNMNKHGNMENNRLFFIYRIILYRTLLLNWHKTYNKDSYFKNYPSLIW